MNLPFSKIRNFILIAAIVVFAGGIGYQLGLRKANISISPEKRLILNQQVPATAPVDFALFWDVWGRLFRFYIDRASMDPQ
ncbi:MAG: hypothetical protein AAB889_05120, partial [Patescibacteria group bacterium]